MIYNRTTLWQDQTLWFVYGYNYNAYNLHLFTSKQQIEMFIYIKGCLFSDLDNTQKLIPIFSNQIQKLYIDIYGYIRDRIKRSKSSV